MKHLVRAIGLLVALCALSHAAVGSEPPPQPFELVRSLRSLQDLAAMGNVSAPAQYRRLSAQIAGQLIAADMEVWSEPKNVRAAVMYVLSGGDPRVLRALFRLRSLPGVDDKLLNGALAFGEGRNKDALELLSSIDPRSLDPALGAQVALVMSTLVAPTDPKKAAALLDDARILAPGTLIEEAALRREIYVVATLENVGAFELLASQYMRRFPDSVYASSFREQFAEMAVRLDYGRDADWQARLARLLSDTGRGHQVQFYLAIARRSVMQGKEALAGFSAGRAIELSDDGSADRERALVYRAAASIVGPDYERAVSDLERVTRMKLDKDDIELADAALAVAAEVRRPSAPLGLPLAAAAPDPAQLGRERIAGTLKSAQSTIARVDNMLSEGRR